MYHQPQRAKRLFFDVIPRAVDDYIAAKLPAKGGDDPANPAWHIGGGRISPRTRPARCRSPCC